MSPYAEYPDLAALPISEVTDLLRWMCRQELERGTSPEDLLALIPQLLDQERYETAQAITDTVAAFRGNSQLGLFPYPRPTA